ncbi:hypothetical protein LXD69_07365 [Flavobacterium sediminilitoris]|uniref:Uncharacterized protein n=1 Tax=Flavobacterium sediminilitoris TaxID=2024526 RepID=A0ABY4HRT7_9FLAO|nr:MULTISPECIES: hypothetical protein [Flavobacterium]UOX35330.1 hypothetical protein LXD69_07365 [Flavobacterium sediminilitoris]
MSIKYYEIFSKNEIFEDPVINTSLNQIFTFLINVISEEIVTTELLVDGDVAKLLQGVTFTTTISKVELITANMTIFNFFKSSYNNFKVSQVIIQDYEIQILINGKLIIIKYSSIPLISKNIGGIYVKQLNVPIWE